jgi:hypothetical protein
VVLKIRFTKKWLKVTLCVLKLSAVANVIVIVSLMCRSRHYMILEWQLSMTGADAEVAKALVGQPVLSSLAYTCQHHWGEPKGSISSPLTLSQQQGVRNRQFQWTVLTVRASMHCWDDIEGLLITKVRYIHICLCCQISSAVCTRVIQWELLSQSKVSTAWSRALATPLCQG